MPNVIKPKNSQTADAVPTTGDLADKEFAINTTDKIIYQRVGGVIVPVANYSEGGGVDEADAIAYAIALG